MQLAAKYNAALPEYAIDAEALTEKITAFINREGTGESAENGDVYKRQSMTAC